MIGSKPSRPSLPPPFKIHGGKFYLAPAHHQSLSVTDHGSVIVRRVDVFGGGGSWLLSAPQDGAREIYNDRDPFKYNVMRVLRDRFPALKKRLSKVNYAEKTWLAAKRRIDASRGKPIDAPNVSLAVDFIVASRMSRGGMGETFGESTRQRGGRNEYLNSWMSFQQVLPAIAARLNHWEITNKTALELIEEFGDDPQTLLYLDPPYLPETRTVPDVYDFEMTAADHQQLLIALVNCRSPVALCGYPASLYSKALRTWTCWMWRVKNNSAQGKIKATRIECLWTNRHPTQANHALNKAA